MKLRVYIVYGLASMVLIISMLFLYRYTWGFDHYRNHKACISEMGIKIPDERLLANHKIVHRIRPRFNSEYVWNRPGLEAIGGLALDYHTKPLWITQP